MKRIAEVPSAFHDDACFGEGVEDLAIEKLIAEGGVDALDVSILPRVPRLDVGGLCAHGRDPVLNRLCNALGAVIRSGELRDAPEDVEVEEDVEWPAPLKVMRLCIWI